MWLLLVCPLACLKDNMSKLDDIFCACYLWLWFGLRLTAMHTLCISGFVDDVMLSRNGAYGEVIIIETRIVCFVMSWPRIGAPDVAMFSQVRQVAAPVGGRASRLCLLFSLTTVWPGAKSAVLDCIVNTSICGYRDLSERRATTRIVLTER